MIFFPKKLEEVARYTGTFRAGSTDLWDRRRKKLHRGDLIDLRDVAELHGDIVIMDTGSVRIPAMMTVAELARQSREIGHNVLVQAASELATPAIRNVATVGGNLMQEVRCSYFRSGVASCARNGGASCPAKEGEHRYLSAIDLGGCIAPHPSTLAMTFAALGASVICGRGDEITEIPIEELWLSPQPHLIHAVQLQGAQKNTFSAWHRISNRSHAEWPLVEVALVIQTDEKGAIQNVRSYAGGVAKDPFPLLNLLDSWQGKDISKISISRDKRYLSSFSLLPQSKYKDILLTQALRNALKQIQEKL